VTRAAVRWLLLFGLVTAVGLPDIVEAQRGRPPVRRPTAGIRKGGAKADTTRKEIVQWMEPDSLITELLNRAGYAHTRYQGDSLIFHADSNSLTLIGKNAAVTREEAILVGDTIRYNRSTDVAVALGDTVILRDPEHHDYDVVARDSLVFTKGESRASVTDVSTSFDAGQRWYVWGEKAVLEIDTSAAKENLTWLRNGTITTCDDSIPDYYLRASRLKMISKRWLFSGSTTLYIGDVPVFWMPFFFADLHSGRHSGMLPMRFSPTDIVRTSPNLRRRIENVGYFFAINDYLDAQTWLDWRSGSHATDADPGYTTLNGELKYTWLDRAMDGTIAFSQSFYTDKRTTTSFHINHRERFSMTRTLNADINYTSNSIRQQNGLRDPLLALAAIGSQLNYTQSFGQVGMSLGGSRRQYVGRAEIDQNFPNISMTTPTISVGKWLDWSPSLSLSNQQSFHVTGQNALAYRYFTRDGVRDSSRVDANRRSSQINFNTPISIFGFRWDNYFRVSDREDDFPDIRLVVDPNDTSIKTSRVFSKTFRTEIDWNTSVTLPTILQGTLNVSPRVSINNVDPAGYWVRTEFTGNSYVHQKKRVSYGATASPTFYGFFPGLGLLEQIRHSVTPVVGYFRSPAAQVDAEFLRALNETRTHYIGDIAQEKVSVGLSQVFEGKLKKAPTDTSEEWKKVKLLAVNFSPIEYDFERARVTGRSGIATDAFRYDITSDLLPGLNVGVSYSLFQGSLLSDTAEFKPFRQGIDASLSVNKESAIARAVSRIFGGGGSSLNDTTTQRLTPASMDTGSRTSMPVTGSYVRDRNFTEINREWRASFSYTNSRQRPPVGGNVVTYDPRSACLPYVNNISLYNQCILAAQTGNPGTGGNPPTTAGAPIILYPARQTVQSSMNFPLTQTWAVDWQTTYDFTNHEFASHAVRLQRDLHDWLANFVFHRSPNGSFLFTFDVSLKANSDVRFHYPKVSNRQIIR
jgi:hypothetical protein